jgi:hypothetical protein
VRRALLVVFLTLLTFDLSGLTALCGEGDCDESCPTDVSGGQCAPNCHFCSCCSLPKVTPSASSTLSAPAGRLVTWFAKGAQVTSTVPGDIMHVPKLLLA